MNEFEKTLQKICEEDTEYDVLWAQWIYDKRLITRALQSVGGLFPHYSLHDASHSTTILRQLARVLGADRIKQLSPTDIWLLLEAAYLHDIGMVVAEAQKMAWWEERAFQVHLTRLANSTDEDLSGAAKLLSSKAGVQDLGGDWPFEIQRALVLVMADYARSQHPGLAEKIIGQPDLIGLESPRTKLIPHRAIQLLGKICRHHGSTFEKMFELPARESGYGTDEAHPRFVACMLRLGDLLDLDDGRFCPVLMKTFGPLPLSSRAHERKHASIERLLVSPTRIEVEAVCDDVEAFDEAERWLSWLRNELREQAARWADIVPTDRFGALPGTGDIIARLRGYLTFEDGRRPRFEVDREAMTNMVRGANLYEYPVSFVRELLQNAVDATLLRVWNEHRDSVLGWERDPKKHDGMLSSLRDLLGNYPIRVEVTSVELPTENASGTEPGIRISIDDQGFGISRGDLRYLQSIGGSRNNQRRLERKMGMPEWMRPSGIFGIGLQSAFVFAKELTLTTRADDGFDSLRITLLRGPKGSAGQILVQALSGQEARNTPGTRVECEIPVSRIPERIRGVNRRGEAEFVVAEFDGVTELALPYEVAAARDEVRSFASESICSVLLNNEALGGGIKTSRRVEENVSAGRLRNSYFFDRQSCVELKNLVAERRSSGFKLLYRGVVTEERKSAMLLAGEIDLHFGQADEILMLSRERVLRSANELIDERLNGAIFRVFPRYYAALLSGGGENSVAQEEVRAASLFAELYGHKCNPPVVSSKPQWRDAQWIPGATLGKIVDADVVEVVEPMRASALIPQRERVEIESRDGQTRAIIYLGESHGREPWLSALLLKNRKIVFAVRREESSPGEEATQSCRIYRFIRDDVGVVDPVDGALALKEIFRQLRNLWGVGYRYTIPCPHDFALLQVNEQPPYARRIEPEVYPRMISPFSERDGKIVTPNLVDVVRWTVRHTGSQGVRELSERDGAKAHLTVANALMGFVFHVDGLMANEWAARRAYDLNEASFELRKAFGSEVIGVRPSTQEPQYAVVVQKQKRRPRRKSRSSQ